MFLRNLGIGLLLTTLIFMIIPIMAVIDDPVVALESPIFYVVLIFLPLTIGLYLLVLVRKK